MLVIHGQILAMTEKTPIVDDGAIAIVGERIEAVGSTKKITKRFRYPSRVIDATDKLVIPGFVNAHTHMIHTLIKGLGDGLSLETWLEKIARPIRDNLSASDLYWGAMLSCLESIKSGTTCLVDNVPGPKTATAIDAVAKAFYESGVRGYVARTMNFPEWKKQRAEDSVALQELVSKELEIIQEKDLVWKKKTNGRVRVCPAPSAIYRCPPEVFRESKKISDTSGVPIHSHIAEATFEVDSTLAEFGCREVDLLDKLGVLGPRFHVVHGVHLDEEEIQRLAKSGASVIHCPVSNMFLGSGIAKIPAMVANGVNVALGTDGGACGNGHNMFPVMKAAALLHKVSTLNPGAMTAKHVLSMATRGGAKALGLQGAVGTIEVGKLADLVVMNLKTVGTSPIHDPLATLVFYADSSNVETVIVNGRILMEDKEVKVLDERVVVEEAATRAQRLVNTAGIKS